jgi:selenobiotic family peptide radical SAM maturase
LNAILAVSSLRIILPGTMMNDGIIQKMEEIYPHCRSCLEAGTWAEMIEAMQGEEGADVFADLLSSRIAGGSIPPFLSDLARLEGSIYRVKNKKCLFTPEDHPTVNPSLDLISLSWKNLPAFMNSGTEPEEGPEMVVAFRNPRTGELTTRVASDDDLLALKLLVEGISSKEAARQGKVSVARVDSALDRAFRGGLLLSPPTKIRRDPQASPLNEHTDESFISASVFTLQWHVTQACDLHCKHCYDRSERRSLSLTQALKILEDLYDFCKSRNVRGQVSFTGGNPLLYPRFMELYRAASDLGFTLAILGNPAPRTKIQRIVAVEPPAFYQVSLEGLRNHNDEIRGPGHYDRVMTFLDVLRNSGIYSMVMLTLTRDNIDQVIPLAEELRNKADLFTFNRLSMVGEGAKLQLPSKERYAAFLEEYVEASRENAAIALKDNLINIVLHGKGADLFGGCAGYGCGAAFNFISVLPDGEAHACRKFPSPIGNVREEGIGGVYDSEAARRYRSGCAACSRCAIRPVCGGCLAVSHSFGLNVFEERDPFCFIP